MKEKLKLKYRFILNIIAFLKKLNFPRVRFKDSDDFQKILIISNTGIGDTMWGTPALKMIRNKYPKSHITVLTSFLSHQVLINNPDLDEMILLKRGGNIPLIRHYMSLYRKRFDTIIIFHSSNKWIIPHCYFLAPKHLIAFKHDAKMFESLLTEVLEAKLNHPIIQRLMLAKRIGVQEEEHQIQIYLKASEHEQADKFLSQFHFDLRKPIVGLQPGASDLFKCWPLYKFVDLAKRLYEELEAQIVIFGNKDEISYAKEIKKVASIAIAAGQIPLRVSAALMKKMDLFITNDTGPLHLAIAQKVPLITLFGPTPHHLCWPHLENPNVRIIARPIPCIQCVGKSCKLPFCLEQLEVQEVLDNAKSLLQIKDNAMITSAH